MEEDQREDREQQQGKVIPETGLWGFGVLQGRAMSTLRPAAAQASPGSSFTILTAASSDVTVSRACRLQGAAG